MLHMDGGAPALDVSFFGAMPFVTLGIGIVVMVVASLFFKVGLRGYESAGH